MYAEVGADKAYLDELRRRWGLDMPLYYQDLSFMGGLVQEDFGYSFAKSLKVRDIYLERLPNSLKLGFGAFIISLSISCMPMSTLASGFRARYCPQHPIDSPEPPRVRRRVQPVSARTPKAAGHDRRVRLAANSAIDRQALNEVERFGLGLVTGSIIARSLEFAWPLEPYPYDPGEAKRLLAQAGYPNGFDAGDITPLPPFVTMGESVANHLAAIGIRTKVRTMERAAYLAAYREKKLRGLILNVTAVLGNAANRIETSVLSTGTYAYGGYPDLDDLFRQQAVERDRSKREALLHHMQRLMQERVMHAPIFDSVPLHEGGPRVEEPAVGLNPLLYFTAPYEEMRLKQP
jgi:hypothetical protein